MEDGVVDPAFLDHRREQRAGLLDDLRALGKPRAQRAAVSAAAHRGARGENQDRAGARRERGLHAGLDHAEDRQFLRRRAGSPLIAALDAELHATTIASTPASSSVRVHAPLSSATCAALFPP